jgi:hypothetical protein
VNIFALDYDTVLCAQYHCDRHIVKMPSEVAQMLSAVNGGPWNVPKSVSKHGCTLWAKETQGNYAWLVNYGISLCKEYTYRYGREHAAEEVIESLRFPLIVLKLGPLRPFYLAMPDEFKKTNPIESYRSYYRHKKDTIQFNHTKRPVPDWL